MHSTSIKNMDDRLPAQIPNNTRNLRACLICAVVLPQSGFLSHGCPNCDFLDLAHSSDAVQECTSSVFEGTIALSDPKTSWVARWQRVDKYVPGVYAVKVVGQLSEDRILEAQEAGVKYFP